MSISVHFQIQLNLSIMQQNKGKTAKLAKQKLLPMANTLVKETVSQSSEPQIAFTAYTLVRIRDPQNKKVLFVSYQPRNIYEEYEVDTKTLPSMKEGEIVVKSKDGKLQTISVGKMQPSFSIFLLNYASKNSNNQVPAPQIFLSWRRLKNGWPISCTRDIMNTYFLCATGAERDCLNGWTNEPIVEDFKTLGRIQCDKERKGPMQREFESLVEAALAEAALAEAALARFAESKTSGGCPSKNSYIAELTAKMPTIDQVLHEHDYWKKRGEVDVPEMALFLDHSPNVWHFTTLFN